MEIPINPMAPWTGAVIGGDLDNAVEKMAHVMLTVMCEKRLAVTTDTPIMLFPIRDPEEPKWCQCLEAACDLTREQFNDGWAQMAKYAQYLFNLQHNTGCTIIEQRVHMNTYEEQSIQMSLELERLGHKNLILRQGMFGIRKKD
jgi:hypothetical protein